MRRRSSFSTRTPARGLLDRADPRVEARPRLRERNRRSKKKKGKMIFSVKPISIFGELWGIGGKKNREQAELKNEEEQGR